MTIGTDHTTVIAMSISDLLAENQALRDEALGWHKRCDELERPILPGGIRILIETTDPSMGQWLEDLVLERIGLRKKVENLETIIMEWQTEAIRLQGVLDGIKAKNPCVSPED